MNAIDKEHVVYMVFARSYAEYNSVKQKKIKDV